MIRVAAHMLVLGLLGVVATLSSNGCAQSHLEVVFGDQGLKQLSYKGVVLEDLETVPSDAFHIWHMKATDMSGHILTGKQYGWGEVNNGRSWNSATHTLTYTFVWGSIRVGFSQSGDTLNMAVTTTNAADSGIIFDGAAIYPFVLHFPQTPSGFSTPPAATLAFNVDAPSVTLADYAQGEAVLVVPEPSRPLYTGFEPAGTLNAFTPLISGTAPDGLAVFQPHSDRPVLPGQSDTVHISLRFAPSATPLASIASDVYRNWAQAWPSLVNWTDRRVVGTVYLATSPPGDASRPGGYPNNPRRYFNESDATRFDVRTDAGLAAFQTRVLRQAATNVQNLVKLKAQGAITWDIEGQQYAQPTSYACAPDQIARLAPEMESAVILPGSAYRGIKLIDAYFKTMRDAGFKVGVCVRPQHLTLRRDGTARQVYLPEADVAEELIRKMKYAHDRWGATLFYVDSSVGPDGAVLSPDIFRKVSAQLPDSLLVPEEAAPKHYAYSAPFKSFIFHTDLGTDPSVYSYYPRAFSLNLINDVDSAKLARFTPELTESVRRGDILMVHADYWQANNDMAVQIYKAAAPGK